MGRLKNGGLNWRQFIDWETARSSKRALAIAGQSRRRLCRKSGFV